MAYYTKDKIMTLMKLQITLDAAAWLLELSPRRVTELAHDGLIKKADHGAYSLGVLREYCYFLKQAAQNRSGAQPGDDSISAVNKRLRTAQAEREELELHKLRSDLVPVADFRQQFGQACMSIRERLLTLAPRVAPDLEGKNRQKIEEIITAEVREILTVLASTENGNGIHHHKLRREKGARGRNRRGLAAPGPAADAHS